MTNPEDKRRYKRAELKAKVDWGQDETIDDSLWIRSECGCFGGFHGS